MLTTYSLPTRWRLQFSLRTVMFLMFASAAFLGWLNLHFDRALKEREIADKLQRLGVTVGFHDHNQPVSTTIARFLLPIWGDRPVTRATSATITRTWGPIPPEAWEYIQQLTVLESMSLPDVHFRESLAELRKVTGVRMLWIGPTEINDELISGLQQLRHLREIGLDVSGLRNTEIEKLKKACPNLEIHTLIVCGGSVSGVPWAPGEHAVTNRRRAPSGHQR